MPIVQFEKLDLRDILYPSIISLRHGRTFGRGLLTHSLSRRSPPFYCTEIRSPFTTLFVSLAKHRCRGCHCWLVQQCISFGTSG
jgi:hypothetical protein